MLTAASGSLNHLTFLWPVQFSSSHQNSNVGGGVSVILVNLNWESQIKEDEVGIACGIYGGNIKEVDHLVYPDVDRMIILKWTLKKGWQGMDWIHLAHGRGMWQAHINMVMQGIWLGEELSASQRTLPCTVSMDLCWQRIIPALGEAIRMAQTATQPYRPVQSGFDFLSLLHFPTTWPIDSNAIQSTPSLPAHVKCLFVSTVRYAFRLQLQSV
jgi:hypothetical protein